MRKETLIGTRLFEILYIINLYCISDSSSDESIIKNSKPTPKLQKTIFEHSHNHNYKQSYIESYRSDGDDSESEYTPEG